MSKTWRNIHPDFRLNGLAYEPKSLTEFANGLIGSTEEFEIAVGEFLVEWLNDSNTIPVETSGSTGQPKTIQIRKDHCINSARATGNYFRLLPKHTALLCLSAKYIAGKMMLVRAMVLGLKLDVVEPGSQPLQTGSKKYDFAAMVPLQVANSVEQLDRLGILIIGGSPVSNTLRALLVQSATQIFETYGMTETITHIAVRPIKDESFEVMPDVSISLDERECLVIRAPKVASRKIVTNDLVRLVDQKHFVWLGRHDNVINSGGIKLIPEQIEAKLSKVISDRFFVTGIKDEELGEKLVLLIEGDLDSGYFLDKIKSLDSLNRYEIPKHIYTVKEFAATPTGKVKRLESFEKLGI